MLTKALQLHPTAAGLWSHAAAWELQHNGNAGAARTLMQRGLRMARGSDHLWVEYFRLELTYAQRLATRRRVLGIDGNGERLLLAMPAPILNCGTDRTGNFPTLPCTACQLPFCGRMLSAALTNART